MNWVTRLLRTLLLLVLILIVQGMLALVASRYAQIYLFVAMAVLLPSSYWFRCRFRLACAVFACVTFVVAASPVDIFVRQDGRGLRVSLLPASYGLACEDHTRFACYGCIVPPYPVSHAVVISY